MLVPYLDQTTPNDMKHGHYLVLSAKCLTSRSGEFISCGRVDRIMYFWDTSSFVKVHHIRSHAEAQCYLYCLLGLILYKMIYSLPYTYYKKEVRTMTSYSTWYHITGAMLMSKEWRHVLLCPPLLHPQKTMMSVALLESIVVPVVPSSFWSQEQADDPIEHLQTRGVTNTERGGHQ